MSTEQNINIAMEFINGLNSADMSQWKKLLASDFTADYPGASQLNKEQAAIYNEVFFPAFPDLHFDVHHVVANCDIVVIHWTGAGTHKGTLTTLSGQSIPPTGRYAAVPGVLISEIRGGRIVREYTYWDQTSLLTQLGLMPVA